MDVNESVGNIVGFYFIADSSNSDMDGCYSLNDKTVKNSIIKISERGHEVCLHGSYTSYNNFDKIRKESDLLKGLLVEEGISQNVFGGRQHYLRWNSTVSARNLSDIGCCYDSTLAYAEDPGFRCGTCHEFIMYDLLEQKTLKIIQRPLVIMEGFVFFNNYLGMDYSVETLNYALRFKAVCEKFGGGFTLLWHNSHLVDKKDGDFFLELIE